MSMRVSGPFAVLVGAALSVSGATQAPPATQNPTEVVSVTGCMRENPERPGAFLLEPESRSAEKAYRLIGSATADLKPHVGHRVKVTGTVARSSGAPAAPARGAVDGPAMNVTMVAMLAESCNAAANK